MDSIEKNIQIISECLINNTYKEVETDRFELKDLSKGWGKDWYKTVCAFLNTNGGVIVIGIRDIDNPPKGSPKQYKYTGYDNSKENENHLKQDLPQKFTDRDGNKLNLTSYISRFEIRDIAIGNGETKRIAVVYVENVSDEIKYVYYEGIAYIRKLTGDHPLREREIETFEEIKKDVISNQELQIITDADISALSYEILNDYISLYNKGKKRGESRKESIENAKSFLHEQVFTRDNHPTLLGMLICGEKPERYIPGKCQADCYVIRPKAKQVAQNKEIIEDNIIELIRRCFNFLWNNIQIGIAYTQGGMADPEYPEELIRESINNAFAHRDYSSDRFVIIEITPLERLSIRNPGKFQTRQRIYKNTEYGNIRRIIPLQVARNSKLTHILKSFNYWEGKGRGLTSLIDACLDNQIDVPYYILSQDEIQLVIPKGKVYDDKMELWINSFKGYILDKLGRELSDEERIILSFLNKSEELNRLDLYTILITSANNHTATIATLREAQLIFENAESDELYPIYQVDRTLMKRTFFPNLKELFKKEWDSLPLISQQVLEAIYIHTKFGLPSIAVSANSIATYLYIRTHGSTSDVRAYENFRAKIRGVFTRLEDNGFIKRKDGKTKEQKGKPDFIINEQRKSSPTLF